MNNKLLVLTTTLLLTANSYADGLSDLKTALSSLKGTSPLAATLTTTNVYQQGEDDDKDKVIREGEGQVILFDNEHGLQITYSKSTLEKLEREASQRVKNEDAKTPTLNAINRNSATDLRTMLSAASSIERTIARAKFTHEEQVEIDGYAYRSLHFDLPVNAIINDKRTREYVKKFNSNYQIIIDDNGVPVETKLEFSGKGRAYIVLSVKASGFNHAKYQVVDQRLVRVTNETGSQFDSTFGFSQRKALESIEINQQSAIAKVLHNSNES